METTWNEAAHEALVLFLDFPLFNHFFPFFLTKLEYMRLSDVYEHTYSLFWIFCLQIGYHSLSKPIPKGFFSHVFQQFQQLNQAKWQKRERVKNECLKDLIALKTSTFAPRRLNKFPSARIYFPREALNEMLCQQTIGSSIFHEVLSSSTSSPSLQGYT